MNTLEAITTRRSIRRYTPEPVSREEIEEIIAAAAYAPSWKNTQTVRYIAVCDSAKKDEIANTMLNAHNAEIVNTAPALVAMVSKRGVCGYNADGSFTTEKGEGWQYFDAGIACQTFCLAAHEKGLGTVIMGLYDEHKLPKFLGVKEDEQMTALIALGHADAHPAAPARKSVDELVRFL